MGKVKYNSSAQEEWNNRTRNLKANSDFIPIFNEDLLSVLPKSARMTCIELGALPGGFLAYFHNNFGYRVTGLDFASNSSVFEDTMKKNSVHKWRFIQADINTYNSDEEYDVVTSFGFIEHFNDVDDILKKHIRLVKPGGYLVVSVPNFRKVQYVYHYVFDHRNLRIHNIDTMKVSAMKKRFSRLGMQEVSIKYIGEAEFWYEDEWNLAIPSRIRNRVTEFGNRIFKDARPSPIYSPMILYVYKKPSTG